MSSLPSLPGCLLLGPAAVARVLRAPRVIALVSLPVLALSVATAWPAHAKLGAALDRLPGASGRFGRVLLEDVARVHPDTRIEVGAAALIAMLLWTFFAGGVSACVGRDESGSSPPGASRLRVFLAECGNWFFTSLRCWIVLVVMLWLWTWLALGVLEPWAQGLLLSGGNEAAQLRYDIAVNLVWFLGFAKLLILRRLALGRLAVAGRRSALLAWGASIALLARRPLRALTAYAGLFAVWAVGIGACALAVDRCVESNRLLLGLALGLAALAWCQIGLAASFVLARRVWELEGIPVATADGAQDGDSSFVAVARTVH